MEKEIETSGKDTIKSFSSPRLSPEEKLYVRVYLHTLSHSKAYEAVKPGLKRYSDYSTSNSFSKRENVKFHISSGLQDKAEALTLTSEDVLSRLYKEATREGYGANHSARVQALVQLGKHFGLFEEKKEDHSFTFNIVNYSNEEQGVKPISRLEDDIENNNIDLLEDLPEDKVIIDLLEDLPEASDSSTVNFKIVEYSND